MIVTEEEAKTKRCQEQMIALNGAITLNCIGSACMAWRWRIADAPWRDKGDMHSQGYCGKAGKP